VVEKNQLSRRKSALPHQQKVNFFFTTSAKKKQNMVNQNSSTLQGSNQKNIILIKTKLNTLL
jgi:hypothetical protein